MYYLQRQLNGKLVLFWVAPWLWAEGNQRCAQRMDFHHAAGAFSEYFNCVMKCLQCVYQSKGKFDFFGLFLWWGWSKVPFGEEKILFFMLGWCKIWCTIKVQSNTSSMRVLPWFISQTFTHKNKKKTIQNQTASLRGWSSQRQSKLLESAFCLCEVLCEGRVTCKLGCLD